MSMLTRAVKAVLACPFRLSARLCKVGEPLTRFFMYRRLIEVVDGIELPQIFGSVLSISGSFYLGRLLGVSSDTIVEADYPEHNVLKLNFEANLFDMILFDQVLEHVRGNPQKAVDELYRVLKPGGILVCATVLVYPIHAYPSDFWRFTPDGLRLLCNRFSKILDCDGWGNMYVWFLAWLGLHLEPVPLCRWHPLHRFAIMNDPNWKIVTWIVAKK